MTIFSWYAPWAWPAWPALGAIKILVGTQTDFADLPNMIKGAVDLLLIVINIAAWALAAFGIWFIARR